MVKSISEIATKLIDVSPCALDSADANAGDQVLDGVYDSSNESWKNKAADMERKSLKLARAYKTYLNSTMSDKDYEKYNTLSKKLGASQNTRLIIEKEVSINQKFRPIDIYVTDGWDEILQIKESSIQGDNMQVSGIEKLKLVKELSGIRGSMAGVASGIAKLKLVKRLGEIRVILGWVAAAISARFSPGDIIYMEDITDKNKRIPVNFRGYVDDVKSMVVWNGSQMQIETDRLFKDDISVPVPAPELPQGLTANEDGLNAELNGHSDMKQEKSLIDAYAKSWQTEADKINTAVASIDWSAITDYASGSEEEIKLRNAASGANDITIARDALRNANIDDYDSKLNFIEESPQFKAHGAAIAAYRTAGDKIRELSKEGTIKSGKEKLANLSPDATLEEKAAAVFEAKGIQGTTGDRIISAINDSDVDSLRSIVGNTDNKASRTVFEMATGIKLEKTMKGTLVQIDEWAGITTEQRATIDADKQSIRDADNLLSDLRYSWNPLEHIQVGTNADAGQTMQDWLVSTYGDGYTHIEKRKKGAATAYWMVNKEHKATGFNKSKVFNAFLKAALAFGEGDILLSMKKSLKSLDIDVNELLTPVERINKAYQFNADDDFKEYLAESIDKTEYSPFLTAKAMDEAAKRNNASIEWGFFGGMSKEDEAHLFGKTLDSVADEIDHDVELIGEDELGATYLPDSYDDAIFDSVILDGIDQDGYVGKISKDGVISGRIDIGGDGKALVFVGESGDVRVKAKSGIDFMYSDDDVGEMIDMLFENILQSEQINEPKMENKPVSVPGDSDETATHSSEEPDEVDNQTEEQVNEAETVEDLVPKVTGSPETEKQRAKLAQLQMLQEQMKSANKVLKNSKLTDEQKQLALSELGYSEAEIYKLMRPDFAGRTGFSYQLTNNNANMASTKKRIAQLEAQDLAAMKAASGESETSYDFDGGSVGLDYGDDRIKILFDTKPGSDMTSKLKQNGFNWSPTNDTWQRKLTDNAIATVNYIFGTEIKTAASMMTEEENKPRPDPIAENHSESLISAFEMELNALKLETDIQAYDSRLDDIFGRIEAAGLTEDMDVALNDTADVLTELLAKAEMA